MPTFPTWDRLPTRYSTGIGRVVSRFATMESRLRHAIYGLAEIDPKIGRLIVRNGRMEDYVYLIGDLLEVRGFTTTAPMTKLAKGCKKIETFRNAIAHGIWVRHHQVPTPVLQLTVAQFGQPAVRQSGPQPKRRKPKIDPLALAVKPTDFTHFTRSTEEAIRIIGKLAREVDRARAQERARSQRQSPQGQSRQGRPKAGS